MTAEDPLVEVIARALLGLRHEEYGWDDMPGHLVDVESVRERYLEDARAVLAAIAETGRLLPEGTETHDEWICANWAGGWHRVCNDPQPTRHRLVYIGPEEQL